MQKGAVFYGICFISAVNLSVPKTSGRRGSLRQITASSSYKDTIKHTVIQSVNLEINRGIIKVGLSSMTLSCAEHNIIPYWQPFKSNFGILL